MTESRTPLLFTCLLLTGVACVEDEMFLYTRLGGDILLPCSKLVPADCYLISWTFYRDGGIQYPQLVKAGKVLRESKMASRLFVTSNCSVVLRHLSVDDAGSYACLRDGKDISRIYLSLLSITSPSSITELQPGGNLSLECILFTFYDSGSCKYSKMFNLSWTDEDGAPLLPGDRYKLIDQSRCHITLAIRLRRQDNNRRWRCHVTPTESATGVFQDFTSSFLFEDPPSGPRGTPPAGADCPVHLPIARIAFCVALPFMVIIVGMSTRRGDANRRPAHNTWSN